MSHQHDFVDAPQHAYPIIQGNCTQVLFSTVTDTATPARKAMGLTKCFQASTRSLILSKAWTEAERQIDGPGKID